MAQSHEDKEHLRKLVAVSFMEKLEAKADTMRSRSMSTIAGGEPEEKELASWKASNKMQVVHMPDDKLGVCRISIGGGNGIPVAMDYCTIRGSVGECIDLLEKAIEALKESP